MTAAAPLGQKTAAILAWLAEHGPATTEEVAIAFDLETLSVRGRLIMLARQGSVAGRLNDAKPPRRVYTITAEGRRRVDLNDPRRVLPRQPG